MDIWYHLQRKIDAEVTIVCEKWQFNSFYSTRKHSLLKDSDNVSFDFMELREGLRWQREPEKYSFIRYLDERQFIHKKIYECDPQLVICDNWVNIIGTHPNVLLLGSFLWVDVLDSLASKSDELDAILNYEKQLLAKHRTPSISIKEMTMPGLAQQTENVGVSWLVSHPFDRLKSSFPTQKKFKVLISAGLSGSSALKLNNLLQHIHDVLEVEYYGGKTTRKKICLLNKKFEIKPFDFSDQRFKDIDLMIARPGVGALTEAIKYQIPIIAVDDGDNYEMNFNAQQVVALDIGWDTINGQVNIDEILRGYALKVISLKERPINGFEQILHIIQKQLPND